MQLRGPKCTAFPSGVPDRSYIRDVTLVQLSHQRAGSSQGSASADSDRELADLLELLNATPLDAEYLLPVLIKVQARFGYVSQPAMRTPSMMLWCVYWSRRAWSPGPKSDVMAAMFAS